jgi:hypothetical protein
VPPDWQQSPPTFLPNLTAAAAAGDANATELLQFGKDVHSLWKVLCRQVCGVIGFRRLLGGFVVWLDNSSSCQVS